MFHAKHGDIPSAAARSYVRPVRSREKPTAAIAENSRRIMSQLCLVLKRTMWALLGSVRGSGSEMSHTAPYRFEAF